MDARIITPAKAPNRTISERWVYFRARDARIRDTLAQDAQAWLLESDSFLTWCRAAGLHPERARERLRLMLSPGGGKATIFAVTGK